MSVQPFRLPAERAPDARIDRAEPMRFSFDGARYEGFAGDSLASALLANGVTLLGRSFKYHRPRGVLGAGVEEPNALVEIGEGARREPNTRATVQELHDGLIARSQNRFPSLRFDLMAINQLFAPFLAGGFYYKTFMWPPQFWERIYEPMIRRAAGLGRASGLPDPDRYAHENAFVDVLVIGGGPAGIAAAQAATASGADVMLVDENPHLGGALHRDVERIDGLPGLAWADRARARLEKAPNVRLLTRATAFGLYENGVVGMLERIGDHLARPPAGMPRQKLWRIRAQRIVIATGAIERPLVFASNDLPGVMLASAVRTYVRRYAVAPGKRVVLATTCDDGYRTAIALREAGIDVPVIADARAEPGPIAARAEAMGCEVRSASFVRKAHGWRRVSGVTLQSLDGAEAGHLACDCLAVAGGYSASVHLSTMTGARPVWSDALATFTPVEEAGRARSVGAAAGVFDLAECLASGARAGAEAAEACGFSAQPPRFACERRDVGPIAQLWRAPGPGKAFVDLQNDVTADDVLLAEREGYGRIEHAKRYTTLGMATDQGKLGNVAGIAILAEARGEPIEQVGVTTFRPPYAPVAIGAFAGPEVGSSFAPLRLSSIHPLHEQAGATFVEAGPWLRPQYYPRAGEDIDAATAREAAHVRAKVGVCDVSTLGKIDVFGPDAGVFLDRIYANGFSKLAIGKARYGLMLREDGFVFDDGVTSRLGEDHFFMTTTTANAEAVLAHLEHHHQVHWPELDVAYASATDQWAAVAVAGPASRATLQKALDDGFDLSNAAFPFMAVGSATLKGLPTRVSRISFSGELAYEIATPSRHGPAIWEALMAAGAEHDIAPYGLEALGVLRIEKGHVAGQELDGRTTAIDLGLGGMLSKKKPFVGRALAQRPALSDPNRPRLVGIECVHREERLRGGAHLVDAIPEDRVIDEPSSARSRGWVSSVGWSPQRERWIGLAFLENGADRHGETTIAYFPMKGEAVEVRIASPHFFDPEGERLRG